MSPLRHSVLSTVMLFLLLTCGCAAHIVLSDPPPGAGPVENARGTKACFTGVPIIGDHDELDDLDFVLRADSAGRTYKVRVHEDSVISNRSLLHRLRTRINEIEDIEQVRVSGRYTAQSRAENAEYGTLELEGIAFQDTLGGFEEPWQTDPSKTVPYLLSGFLVSVFVTFGR